MLDKLAIIKRVIDEHQIIKGHVKLVGDSISDQEALLSLQKASADWIPGRLEVLTEKHNKLQQTMSLLDEGLKNHFAFEGKTLPPLLGELLMKALLLEHKEINDEINRVKSVVAGTKLEGSSREELLSREADIQQMINSICELVEEHAAREETILEMLRKAFEEK